MDVADLRIFEAVARLGAINRAATELNTVQSNVTTRIRKLEDDLGAALFDRHSRGVTLTAAGRRLGGTLERVLPAYEHGFGPPVPELLTVGAELRAMLRGEEPER